MKSHFKYSLFFLIFLAVSCKTGKETSLIALPSMTAEERINSIIQSGITYNDWSSDLKIVIKQGKTNKETPVNAQLRIVKSEAIQISLRIPILGSEAFRIVITPDKVLIIDRLNKQYLSETVQDIKTLVPFDFDYYNLEALLTNRLFLAGRQEISPADYPVFQIKEDKFRTHITYSDPQKIFYDFESDYTHRIQDIRIESSNGVSCLQCNYTDWGLTSNNRIFPMTLNLQLQNPDQVYNLNCSYKSIVINTGFTIDDTIPGKYRQVTLRQVLQLIEESL